MYNPCFNLVLPTTMQQFNTELFVRELADYPPHKIIETILENFKQNYLNQNILEGKPNSLTLSQEFVLVETKRTLPFASQTELIEIAQSAILTGHTWRNTLNSITKNDKKNSAIQPGGNQNQQDI